MSLEDGAAAVAVAAIIMYTVFAGADFGGGIWTMFASGPRREDQHNAVERAIGPVWETNHVWLILLVVTLFVTFPTGFAAIFTALYVPLFLALLGIVARGAAFALRHYSDHRGPIAGPALHAFAVASLITPFVFGTIIGALATGDIHVSDGEATSSPWAGWLSPFAIVCGLIGLLTCAFLAATYLTVRTQGALQRDFRNRALMASLLLGIVTTVAIPLAYADASDFADRFTRVEVLTTMAVTAALGVVTLALLARGETRFMPVLAAATAAGVIIAWALAQRPDLILPDLTIHQAAAARFTIKSFLIALPVGAAILIPSLYLLYNTFSRDVIEAGSGPPAH